MSLPAVAENAWTSPARTKDMYRRLARGEGPVLPRQVLAERHTSTGVSPAAGPVEAPGQGSSPG